jgi:cytochrome b subunit of formate dehydrogenase
MIVPPILWFGISIMIYIIARHHPNERVGHYTQQAAYRYYGMIGVVIPVGTFYGTEWELWIMTGGAVGLILIPWTIVCLIKIQKEKWQDTEIEIKETEGEMV